MSGWGGNQFMVPRTQRDNITVAGAEALSQQPDPSWDAVWALERACDGDWYVQRARVEGVGKVTAERVWRAIRNLNGTRERN